VVSRVGELRTWPTYTQAFEFSRRLQTTRSCDDVKHLFRLILILKLPRVSRSEPGLGNSWFVPRSSGPRSYRAS
jgi:hypothetical protein